MLLLITSIFFGSIILYIFIRFMYSYIKFKNRVRRLKHEHLARLRSQE